MRITSPAYMGEIREKRSEENRIKLAACGERGRVVERSVTSGNNVFPIKASQASATPRVARPVAFETQGSHEKL